MARIATKRDLPTMRRRLREEPVSFVKRALAQAIYRVESGDRLQTVYVDDDTPIETDRMTYTRAVDRVTSTLLHEISPHLGAIKVEARRIVPDYEASLLKRRIDGLGAVLEGIEELRKASVTESMIEVNLFVLIEDVAAIESRGTKVPVSLQGPRDLVAIVDPSLLRIALSNGIRNAIEATQTAEGAQPVVIAFGQTEVDYWVAVIDSGPGLPAQAEAAFEFGRSTKAGHRGLGLALVRQAMTTLDGSATLESARTGGARLEMRWFR